MQGRALSSASEKASSAATRFASLIASLIAGALSLALAPSNALGQDASSPGLSPDSQQAATFRRLSGPPGQYARVVTTIAFGDGMRFNNPYRLQTQLGATGESLSITAPYIDLGIAASFGAPDGLQHGGALRLSASLKGVAQGVLTPSYFAAYRGPRRWLAFGRFGLPIVLSPDVTAGIELGAGISYFATAKIGFFGELIGDVFYGAGTYDVRYGVYPILSAQAGLMIDTEILP